MRPSNARAADAQQQILPRPFVESADYEAAIIAPAKIESFLMAVVEINAVSECWGRPYQPDRRRRRCQNRSPGRKRVTHYKEAPAAPLDGGISECLFMDDDREMCNYAFVDSKAEPGIQVSDALTGLLGKMFSFAARHDMKDVIAARKGLAPAQRRTLGKLNDLLDRSQAETRAFFEQVAPLDDLQAGLYFLEGR